MTRQCQYFYYTLLAFVSIVRKSQPTPSSSVDDVNGFFTQDIVMPGVRPTKGDQYLCRKIKTPSNASDEVYAYRFEASSNNFSRIHHMLLFTCDDDEDDGDKSLNGSYVWTCDQHFHICADNYRVIYSWGKGAPPMTLPQGVALRVGTHHVLQIHYGSPWSEGDSDTSGFQVTFSRTRPRYFAGYVALWKSQMSIPPKTKVFHAEANCHIDMPKPIYPFAYRIHTHGLGIRVSGYKVTLNKDSSKNSIEEIGEGDPQLPQAFYPMSNQNMTIRQYDFVAIRCTYSSLSVNHTTEAGQRINDEMCNFYVMYYTTSSNPYSHFISCVDEENEHVSTLIPERPELIGADASTKHSAHGHHNK